MKIAVGAEESEVDAVETGALAVLVVEVALRIPQEATVVIVILHIPAQAEAGVAVAVKNESGREVTVAVAMIPDGADPDHREKKNEGRRQIAVRTEIIAGAGAGVEIRTEREAVEVVPDLEIKRKNLPGTYRRIEMERKLDRILNHHHGHNLAPCLDQDQDHHHRCPGTNGRREVSLKVRALREKEMETAIRDVRRVPIQEVRVGVLHEIAIAVQSVLQSNRRKGVDREAIDLNLVLGRVVVVVAAAAVHQCRGRVQRVGND